MDKFVISGKNIIMMDKRDELIKQATEANKDIFNNNTFREKQLDIIISVLENRDTFVVMPTGGGKTLCYTLPAVLSKGVTIVITPLLSLMEDQVSKLINGGIPAAYLSSTCTASQITDVHSELRRAFKFGQEPYLKLLYLTPEGLLNTHTIKEIINELYQNEFLARFVVDEAHCVSSWGHDFRKDYQSLNYFKEKYREIPVLALTATARSKVITDTCKILRIDGNVNIINSGFDRPNLIFEVRPKNVKIAKTLNEILEFIKAKHHDDTGIIYCMTQKDCETTSDYLRDNGLKKCDYYHAGQTKADRKSVQSAWSNGSVKVVCATIAYGMGIDKPDVRFVIHLSLAKSLEGYYQEAGRAGRDGQTASCIMYYRHEDVSKLARIMKMPGKGKRKATSSKEKDKKLLQEMESYCEEKETCRREIFASTFVDSEKRRDAVRCTANFCDICKPRLPHELSLKTTSRGASSKNQKNEKTNNKKRKVSEIISIDDDDDDDDDRNGEWIKSRK